MIDRKRLFLFSLLLLPFAALAASHATAQSNRSIVLEYSQRQRQAKLLTERLISARIERQLQQMRDNGLVDLPLYEELSSMRGRIGEIAEKHMSHVQELLAAATTAEGDRRTELLGQAQREMKAILSRLIVEREIVRTRRKRAELIARIGEIITSQENAHLQTRLLSDQNEQAILAAADEQQTTNLLFEQFLNSLTTISAWPGELGAVAADARRILMTSGLSDKLAKIVGQLEQTQFQDAVKTQTEVITELKQIQIQIHKLQDPAWIGNDIQRAVKEVIQEQEAIRKQSKGFAGDDPFGLLDEQTLLQEKLSRLAEKLGPINDRAATLAIRAEEGADRARVAIFNDQMETAVDIQGNVIGTLTELQEELIHNDGRSKRSLSADEYIQLAEQLKQARDVLTAARDKCPSAADNNAKQSLQQASDLLATVKIEKTMTPAVVRRIRTAGSILDDLSKREESVTADSLSLAGELLRFAIGETSQGILDATRSGEAMKVAELNRAAESVSRAVGAVRDEKANVASTRQSPDAKARGDMLARVKTIAEKVSLGTRTLAPDATPALNEAVKKTTQLLTDSAEPSAVDSAKLASQLGELAKSLNAASVQLRTEMTWTAGLLEERVVGEIEQITATEAKLDALADAASPRPADEVRRLGSDLLQRYTTIGAALHAAADHLDARIADSDDNDEPSKLAQRQFERAAVLADIHREELEQLLETIRELVDASERQQEAASDLLDARDELEAGNQVDPQELADAFEQFASTLPEIGQAVEELTDQSELANQPISEAVAAAAGLEPTTEEGQEPEEGLEPGQEPGEGLEPGESLTPSDALGSAELLSGPAVTAIAAEQLGLQPGQSMLPGPGILPGVGLLPGEGIPGPGPPIPQGPKADSAHDVQSAAASQARSKPWTASLPDGIRQSIRSSSRRQLPPRYEQRLNSYFEALLPAETPPE